MLRDYSFFAVYESVETELFPVVNTIVFQDKLDDDLGVYRRTLETELVFNNKNGSLDFDYIYTIESTELCAELEFQIRYKGETKYTGKVRLGSSKVRFDISFCTAFIKLDIDDAYACLFKNWEKEINILLNTDKVSVEAFLGEIQVVECYEPAPASPVDFVISSLPKALSCGYGTPQGWTLVKNEVLGVTVVNPSVPTYEAQIGVRSTYAREFWDISGGTPPGDGWVAVTGGYARIIPAMYNEAASDLNPDGNDFTQVWTIGGYDLESEEELTFTNGVTLQEVLEEFNPCGNDIVSDFFSINPDNTAPDNEAYQKALANLSDLLIFQKSDIKRYQLSSPALNGTWTYKKLWERLRDQFNLKLSVSGNTLRIEHISYGEKAQGLDLTVGNYAKYIAGILSYSYDNSSVARQELWKFQENTSLDFQGVAILYACAGEEDNAEVVYSLEDVNNDITYIISKPDEINDAGFVFVAAYKDGSGGYFLVNENSELSGLLTTNGHLSIPNLQQHYWRWERPLPSGNINNVETIFESSVKRKAQASLSVQIPAEVYWNDFRPEDLIKTGFGWSEIETASYDAQSCILTITPKH